MTPPILFSLIPEDPVAVGLAAATGAERGELAVRRFPDEETYLRYDTPVDGRAVVLLCSLDRPDGKLPPLLFAVAAARELGARQVGLVAPYLAYMRQDRRFRPGEAVTSTYVARLLSDHVDWLVTVDPHLHRHRSLAEIYRIPTTVLQAAPLVARWITRDVDRPLLIGPDSESEQWVAAVAHAAGAPYRVLQKIRRGDRDVEVSVPELEQWRDRTPVLVDDIVSTARTMIETVRRLKALGMRPPVCVAVHGLFAGSAYDDLLSAGAGRVVTTNTVAHPTNGIDVISLLAEGVLERLRDLR